MLWAAKMCYRAEDGSCEPAVSRTFFEKLSTILERWEEAQREFVELKREVYERINEELQRNVEDEFMTAAESDLVNRQILKNSIKMEWRRLAADATDLIAKYLDYEQVYTAASCCMPCDADYRYLPCTRPCNHHVHDKMTNEKERAGTHDCLSCNSAVPEGAELEKFSTTGAECLETLLEQGIWKAGAQDTLDKFWKWADRVDTKVKQPMYTSEERELTERIILLLLNPFDVNTDPPPRLLPPPGDTSDEDSDTEDSDDDEEDDDQPDQGGDKNYGQWNSNEEWYGNDQWNQSNWGNWNPSWQSQGWTWNGYQWGLSQNNYGSQQPSQLRLLRFT